MNWWDKLINIKILGLNNDALSIKIFKKVLNYALVLTLKKTESDNKSSFYVEFDSLSVLASMSYWYIGTWTVTLPGLTSGLRWEISGH